MTEGTTSVAYNASVEYVKRGWAVIPLHGIRQGSPDRCTCGAYPCGKDNKNAGKHPVENQWGSAGRISTADCYAVWAEDKPWANVGIVTGKTSGIFVLDEDPKNGGDSSLAGLLAKHGPLPETYTVCTGSGGHHFYFQMPGFSITNKNRDLPEGLDIRGNGGQVVAPPSVSSVGSYEVIKDVPVAPAPEWLLGILRAPDRIDIGETTMVMDLPAYQDLDDDSRDRCARYAEKVIRDECEAYFSAPVGRGSDRLFLACCNLLEIAQSPWNLVTVEAVTQALNNARMSRIANHREGGGQTLEELQTTWRSAQVKVAGKGRALPAKPIDPHAGLYFDTAPFHKAPPASGIADSGGALSSVPVTPVSPEVAQAFDAHAEREALIAREIARLEIVEEAKRRKQTGMTQPAEDFEWAVQSMMAKLLTADDLDDLPNPTPLIVDVLDLDSESWIIGAPGGFKSFVAFDMAGHVGTGQDWRGRPVTQGNVLYIVGEGSKGIKLRKRAWVETYGSLENVHFFPEPVQSADPNAWAVLVEMAKRVKPVFIVLDTQARLTVGLNENTSEIGVFIDAVRQLRAATGACVLVVHHTGRSGGDARGWSGIDGAQDSEIKVVRPEGAERKNLTAEIVFEKQKDSSEDVGFKIQMQEHDWGIDPITKRKLTSLSIKQMDPFYCEPVKEPTWKANITNNQSAVLAVMRDHSDHDGTTRGVIKKWLTEYCKENKVAAIPEGSMDSAIRDLKGKGLLVQDGARYRLGDLS